MTRSPLLHVTNGESAGNTLRQTALGGVVLPWRDVLHAGPVPSGPRARLLEARARFLSECGWGSRRALLASLERRDGRYLEALADGTEVVLWFEHDLYDQLQLLDALALAHAHGAEPDLIVVGSFPGKPGFRGLGELSADELETLWPVRIHAAGDVLDAATRLWAAVRAPEPVALAAAVAQPVEGLPFVVPALRRLLEELPAPEDGLSTTERLALRAVADGAATPQAAFLAAQDLEETPFLGDAWFYRTLAELAGGELPLLGAGGAAAPLGDPQAFAQQKLRVTGSGEQVLAGERDRVALLGIDRWVGGTHVTDGHVWRWDPHAGALADA